MVVERILRKGARNRSALTGVLALATGILVPVVAVEAGSHAASAANTLSSFRATTGLTPSSVEEPSDRTQYTSTYLNSDGSYSLVSTPYPLNYAAGTKGWQPITNTVSPDPSLSGGLVSTGNSWTAHFAPTPTGVTVDTALGDFSFSPVGATSVVPVVTLDGDGALYNDVWPGVSIKYEVENWGIKEDIVFAQAPITPELTFATGSTIYDDVQGGLVPSSAPNQGISVPPPLVENVAGQVLASADPAIGSGSTLTASAGSLAGQQSVNVTLASSYLQSLPASEYPITLDPTLSVTGAGTRSYTSTGANCSCGISVGNDQDGNPNRYWRTVGSFNYSSLDGDDITNATLQMSDLIGGAPQTETISVHHASAASYAGASYGAVLASGTVYYVNPDQAADTVTGSALTSAYNTEAADDVNTWEPGIVGLESAGEYSYEEFADFQMVFTYQTNSPPPTTTTVPATTTTVPATTTTTVPATTTTTVPPPPTCYSTNHCWGLDTTTTQSATSLATAASYYGAYPEFIGRYLTNGGTTADVLSNTTTAGIAEITAFHDDKIPVLLLADVYGACPTAADGQTEATDAAKAAGPTGLNLPANNTIAIFDDVEPNTSPASTCIQAYADTLAADGFIPGFYENPLDETGDFAAPYCAAVAAAPTDANLPRVLMWSQQPNGSQEGEGASPAFAPTTVSKPCADGNTVAWQYAIAASSGTGNLYDNDELLPADIAVLWQP